MPTLARTYLFVPGNRPERFDKACAAGADAVIIDLEDAVPAEARDAARDAVAAWLSPARPVFVRINAAGTPWFERDLGLCGRPGVAGIVLPKAERAEDIARLELAGAKAVLPLIETALGIANLRVLAEAAPVQRLLFGSIDLRLDLGIEGDDEDALLMFRSQLVLASRLASLPAPVEGVSTAIDDAEQLRADTQRARSLGFGAKLCIHPKQLGPVGACFIPSAAELAWAQKVLEAAAASGGAAVSVDGRMIDRPVIERAQRIVDDAQKTGGPGA